MENTDHEQLDNLLAQRLVAKVDAVTDSPATTPSPVHSTGSRTKTTPRPKFVKVEKNLASLGFFTPSSNRVRDEKAKTISFTKTIDGKRVEAKATIAPSALFGLPITADQDKFLALQRIVTDIQQRQGRVENPIGFTSAELLKLLQQQDAGGRYKEIEEWLKVMTLTGIISEGVVYFAGKKQWVSDTFHVFDRAVSTGKELPDGSVADRNYIWLSDWQLENINKNHLLPVDLEAYRQLNNHIAKALVPLLQIWLYASREEGSFSKRYDELCQILNIREHRPVSLIKRQLVPSLDELQAHRYLASWNLERTVDSRGYKVVFRHGEKFHGDRRRRLGGRHDVVDAERVDVRHHLEDADRDVGRRDHRPAVAGVEPAAPTGGKGSVDAVLLDELTKRGITQKHARLTLANLAADQDVLSQIEWGDHVVSEGKIRNPAGFYLYLIRSNVAPPDTFETTSLRRLRDNASKIEDQTEAERARLTLAYQAYVRFETEQCIARLEPADYEARLAAKVGSLKGEFSTFAMWGPDRMQNIAKHALFKDVRQDIGYRLFTYTAFCLSLIHI